MTRIRKWLAVVAGLFIMGGVSAAGVEEHEMTIGKKGEIMFTTDTKIGDSTLKAGHYRLQHNSQGSDHFVQFTLMKGMHRPDHPKTATGFAEAGRIKCRVEKLDEKVRRTTVYTQQKDGERRITRILVNGENVAHLF